MLSNMSQSVDKGGGELMTANLIQEDELQSFDKMDWSLTLCCCPCCCCFG